MVTDIEKQFFDTFGLEPKCEDACELSDEYWDDEHLANEYGVFDNYMEAKGCPIDKDGCTYNCRYSYTKEVYPQITDRILLELICIGTQFFAELVLLTSDNIEDLKEQVLIIYLKTAYKEKITRQVRTLFKEG